MSHWWERPKRVPSIASVEKRLRTLGVGEKQIARHVEELRRRSQESARKEEAGNVEATPSE